MFSTLRSALALLAIVSLVLFVASGQLLAADEAGAEGKGLLTQETEIFIYTIVVFLIAFLISSAFPADITSSTNIKIAIYSFPRDRCWGSPMLLIWSVLTQHNVPNRQLRI